MLSRITQQSNALPLGGKVRDRGSGGQNEYNCLHFSEVANFAERKKSGSMIDKNCLF